MNSDTLCSLTQLILDWLKKKDTVNSKMLKLSHGLTISSNDFITEGGQLFVTEGLFLLVTGYYWREFLILEESWALCG